MQQLIQQNGFHYRAFVLREDDVFVHIRDFKEEREYSVDYVDLGLQFYRKSEYQHRLTNWMSATVLGLCTLGLTLTSLGWAALPSGYLFFFGSVGGLVWLSTVLQQTPATLYLLGGEDRLEFLADHSSSSNELNEFLEALTEKIRDAYQDQYLDEKLDVPAEERRSRIQWLHQMKVLSRSERDVLLAKLGPARGQSIGFKRSA